MNYQDDDKKAPTGGWGDVVRKCGNDDLETGAEIAVMQTVGMRNM